MKTENLVRMIVDCRLWINANVVIICSYICKGPENPSTNPNHVSSHLSRNEIL
jgi:hypothetical protein